MNQARRRLLALDGHGQGRDSQFSSHVVTHRPSNNLPGGKIEHDSQIEPAFRGWHISYVGKPDLIGPIGSEVPIEPVGSDGPIVTAVRSGNRQKSGVTGNRKP